MKFEEMKWRKKNVSEIEEKRRENESEILRKDTESVIKMKMSTYL